MNTSSIISIADNIVLFIREYEDNHSRKVDRRGDVLRASLNNDVSISLIYNNKIERWVLIAERDVSIVPESVRDQLLEKLMDTASHSRADEGLAVGLTVSEKISVSKILVDVSVKKVIINAIERIVKVIMNSKEENSDEVACIIGC